MVWSVKVMDLSPMQSGSKCTSDFSIDRILSEETRGREETAVPSWLCCTRYQPPRIPRPPSQGVRARRSGRHARVPFTAAQAAALEAAYARAPYLAPPALRALAAALQLRDDRIKIWFQNRRARERREKTTNITPPNAVVLPATTFQTPVTWCPQPRITATNAQTSQPKVVTKSLQLCPEINPEIDTVALSQTVIRQNHALRSRVTQFYDIGDRSSTVMYDRGNPNDSSSEESDDQQRPETPLDIETV